MDQRNITEDKKDDGITWWCMLLARSASVFAALVAFSCGIWSLVTFSALCIVGGLWQLSLALMVLLLEGSWCCRCWPVLEKISVFSENRHYWQKGAAYIVCSIISVLLCRSLSIWIGSGFVFAAGVIYGMLALGKKADKNDMIAVAQRSKGEDSDVKLMLSDVSVGQT